MKILARWVFPLMVKRYVRKSQEKFNSQYGGETKKHSKDTDIHIPRKKSQKTPKTNLRGEYIDYEEVEE